VGEVKMIMIEGTSPEIGIGIVENAPGKDEKERGIGTIAVYMYALNIKYSSDHWVISIRLT